MRSDRDLGMVRRNERILSLTDQDSDILDSVFGRLSLEAIRPHSVGRPYGSWPCWRNAEPSSRESSVIVSPRTLRPL